MLYIFHNYALLKGQICGLAAFPIAFLGLSAPVTGSTRPVWYTAPTPTSPIRQDIHKEQINLSSSPKAKKHCSWLPSLIRDTDVHSSEKDGQQHLWQLGATGLQQEWVRGIQDEVHGRTQPTASLLQLRGAGINTCLIQELVFLLAEEKKILLTRTKCKSPTWEQIHMKSLDNLEGLCCMPNTHLQCKKVLRLLTS